MLIHPMPDPIALQIGPLAIHWYGLMYMLAFILFLAVGRIRLKQAHIAAAGWRYEHLEDMLFYGVLGVVVGGRLGEVLFYHPEYYSEHLLEIFAVWKGGMSFHGGFLGVLLALAIWSKKSGRNVLDVYDLIAPLVPLGYACGRIGNFINAELWGRVADPSLPWAMIWPNVDQLPRHPSPIYQALVDGVLAFILLWIYARKQRPRLAVGAMYVLLYGCARFFTEYFRVPDWTVDVVGVQISAGQVLSVPMIIFGIGALYFSYHFEKKPVTA
ncbi:prolipoprotein diacylglyceryl transferase [Solimicrobium silvestre]|uniref:Phosphatidylglycerol--prolipoprotein diacylglyceryl transferase n=1 Tax=Solimicrobium silvestre TaxID=2099400 RepID=A0A2S9GWS1_9BURK|nr:prolipoprotein diacylglyceryl transferase [Solimicrobium silvestre]PRC92106.1 lgt: prolipoprotein diacylglyceryl transferase [Solimicrobium silvestre]